MSRIVLARRRLLRGLGALPFGALLPAVGHAGESPPTPACVLSPQMTEGPFFVDERLHRSDLLGPEAGPGLRDAHPLALTITLVDVRERCAPARGVQVDVWHTDALGRYSDVQGLRGQTFCRGYQVSDVAGRVFFSTIYPGWYPGRAIHIHVKARRFDADPRKTKEFTTQLFFPETTNDVVMAMAPYNRRSGRRTSNASDGIYGDAKSLIVSAVPRKDAPGLAGDVRLGLDLA